jgi:hypothetical protein
MGWQSTGVTALTANTSKAAPRLAQPEMQLPDLGAGLARARVFPQ